MKKSLLPLVPLALIALTILTGALTSCGMQKPPKFHIGQKVKLMTGEVGWVEHCLPGRYQVRIHYGIQFRREGLGASLTDGLVTVAEELLQPFEESNK